MDHHDGRGRLIAKLELREMQGGGFALLVPDMPYFAFADSISNTLQVAALSLPPALAQSECKLKEEVAA